jgi:hypothetical protein
LVVSLGKETVKKIQQKAGNVAPQKYIDIDLRVYETDNRQQDPKVACSFRDINQYLNIQISKYPNIQIHKYTNIQIYKYTNIQISKVNDDEGKHDATV